MIRNSDDVDRYNPRDKGFPCYRRQLCGCGPTPAWRCGQDAVCTPSRAEIEADFLGTANPGHPPLDVLITDGEPRRGSYGLPA